MRIASAAAAEYVLANHDRMYLHTQSGRVWGGGGGMGRGP
jgi:hypothetical protein